MNGVIIIDKPSGKTSHDVVQEVKRTLGLKKAGHTGTLDPLATGVLPVCINEGTKLSQFLVCDKKEYRATMLLGVTTDTYDVDGKIIAEKDPAVEPEEVVKALASLVGERSQQPPPYSSVKYRGKALYKWTREGLDVAVPPRTVEVYSLSIEAVNLPAVTFRVSCSKGTYIRSLCKEVGEILGCGACLAGLRRIKSGCYTEKEALSVMGKDEKEKKESMAAHLITMVDALPGLPAVQVDEPLSEKLRQGYQPTVGNLLDYHIPFLAAGDMLRFTTCRSLVAIAKMMHSSDRLPFLEKQEQAVKIMRVFHGA